MTAAHPTPPAQPPPSPPSLSLQTLILLLTALPVLLLSTALVTLLVLTSSRVSEQLGRQLGDSAIDRVRTETKSFLSPAVALSDLYVHRLATSATLSPTDLDGWLSTLLDDLRANPAVASICFSNPDGNTVWLLRNSGRLEYGRSLSPAPDATREWTVNPDSSADSSADSDALKPLRTYTYSATQRPWFKRATATNEPLWTPIYFWFPDQSNAAVTGTGYTRTVHSPSGTLLGVLVIDVTLASLSDFLSQLPLARDGALFLTDDQSLLVAASDGPTTANANTRHTLLTSTSPSARALAPFLTTQPPSTARTTVAAQPVRVLSSAIAPYPGIDWKLLVSLPESAFLADARSAQRTGTIIAAATALLLVALAVLLSRRLSQPLLALTSHVRKIGSGDLASRIHLSGTRDFHELSAELNAMSAGLAERTEMKHAMELAMQVQQSLLPRSMPTKTSLDIHGLSRYCDATGGDYFDFIDTLDLGGDGVLIAIGDVMGHGIAASLLMNTARAALRASSSTNASLGQMMSRINKVLAQDTRDVRFVTMTLLLVDPVMRRARWASAAHDPVLVYNPESESFTELDGGELPLEPLDSTNYVEYSADNLPPSGILLLGTDGIWEARNPSGLFFGKQPLQHLVRTHALESAKSIANAIDTAHRAFTGSAPITDDITLVIIKLPP